MRESDTVELKLKVRLVEPDSTCSERNNSGHSLRCHAGIKGNRKCFFKKRSELSELQLVHNLVCKT